MNLDHISNLPNEVLSHILSFLTTKEAALTSLLSKRWRNLFALVPNLTIDDSIFLNPEEGKRERDSIRQAFMGFVDRVLALQGDSPIKKLSLECKPGAEQDRVNGWLRNVLRRGVSELDLCIDVEDGYFLPEEVFESETLVNLRLRSEFDVYWWGQGRTYLPKLKSLCISSDRFLCDDKIEMVLRCSPVLEELILRNYCWRDSDETVSSATLRTLVIRGNSSSENPKSISFDTPSLLSLNYYDVMADDYPLVNMRELVEARLSLLVTGDQIERIRASSHEDDDGDVLKLRNVVKLMNGLQNVRELHLSSNTLEVLSLCCDSMPIFNNLEKLIVYSKTYRGWQAMPVLLKNCPRLEHLYIDGLVHYVTDKCGDACDCIYRRDKGRSLKSCPVKLIKIRGFKGTMKEMNMIEHFLDYLPCLKQMEIMMDDDSSLRIGANSPVFDMFEEYKDMYSCKVRVLMSDELSKKWMEELEEEGEVLRTTDALLSTRMPFPTF